MDPRPARPTRHMLPARSGQGTLGSCRDPWICFTCPSCGRWGEYKHQTMLAEFGADIFLPTLLEAFASSRGCALTDHNEAFSQGLSPTRCRIRYRMAGPQGGGT